MKNKGQTQENRWQKDWWRLLVINRLWDFPEGGSFKRSLAEESSRPN